MREKVHFQQFQWKKRLIKCTHIGCRVSADVTAFVCASFNLHNMGKNVSSDEAAHF